MAIIGGGLVGCATAWCLARAGASVTLIERDQVNRHASGQNAGSLHFQLEFRMVDHGDALAEQFAQTIPLLLDAQERWRGLEEELGQDLEVVQQGGLMVAETLDEVERLRRKQRLERAGGLATELLTGDEARSIAPYLSKKVCGALYHPYEGHANPRLVAPAFARAAMNRGARIQTGTRVVSLGREGGKWRVGVDAGASVLADAVLNAAGAWVGSVAALANVHIPMVPLPLSMAVTEKAPVRMDHLIQHAGRRLSMKQVRDGNVLIGGGWPSRFPRGSAGFETERSPRLVYRSLFANLRVAASVVPEVAQLHLIRYWPGVTGVLADQLPVIGEVPGRPGFFVAGGGSAFTLGPTYAWLVSEMILRGSPPIPIDLYSPARFAHLNVFMA